MNQAWNVFRRKLVLGETVATEISPWNRTIQWGWVGHQHWPTNNPNISTPNRPAKLGGNLISQVLTCLRFMRGNGVHQL